MFSFLSGVHSATYCLIAGSHLGVATNDASVDVAKKLGVRLD